MGAAIALNRPKTHSCDYFGEKFGLLSKFTDATPEIDPIILLQYSIRTFFTRGDIFSQLVYKDSSNLQTQREAIDI